MSKQDNDHDTNPISNQIINTDLKNNSNSNSNCLINQDSENQDPENQDLENQDEEIDQTPRSPTTGRSLLPGGITDKERSELSPNSFYDYLFQRNKFGLK